MAHNNETHTANPADTLVRIYIRDTRKARVDNLRRALSYQRGRDYVLIDVYDLALEKGLQLLEREIKAA